MEGSRSGWRATSVAEAGTDAACRHGKTQGAAADKFLRIRSDTPYTHANPYTHARVSHEPGEEALRGLAACRAAHVSRVCCAAYSYSRRGVFIFAARVSQAASGARAVISIV